MLPLCGPARFLYQGDTKYLFSKVLYARLVKIHPWIRFLLKIVSPILWYLKATPSIISLLRNNGNRIRQKQGISVIMQFVSLISLVFLRNTPPFYYYYLQLYNKLYSIGNNFFINKHLIPIYSNLLGNRKIAHALHNKEKFYNHLSDEKIALIKNELLLSNSNIDELIDLSRTINSDLFIKPSSGSSGRNCYILRLLPNSKPSLFLLNKSLDYENTIVYLQHLSKNELYLVQRKFNNHQSIENITNSSLATCRVNTYVNEYNEVAVLFAMFLMPTGNAITSNGSKGGIISPVDVKSGIIGKAISMRDPFKLIEYHPDGHGYIPSKQLPFWNKVVEQCIKAHHSFLELPIIGWDVALTDEGPKLLEGNLGWSVEAWQLTHQKTFDADRFISILSWHVRKYLSIKPETKFQN